MFAQTRKSGKNQGIKLIKKSGNFSVKVREFKENMEIRIVP